MLQSHNELRQAIFELGEIRRQQEELRSRDWSLSFEIAHAVDQLLSLDEVNREKRFICDQQVVAVRKDGVTDKVQLYKLSAIQRLTEDGLETIPAEEGVEARATK